MSESVDLQPHSTTDLPSASAGPLWIRSGWLTSASTKAGLAFGVLCLYFFASWEVRPLFFSNQNTYFLQGLRMAGVAGLQHDWLSATKAPHIVFSTLIAVLQRSAHLTAGVHILETLLYVALLWSFWTLSGSGKPRTVVLRFVACAVFFILMTERGPWHRLFTWIGLADQYVFGGYLQPSEFGIAMLAAFALLVQKRHKLAIICLVLASSLHASYLLPCGMLTLSIAVELLRVRNIRGSVALLALFGVGVLPIVLYGLSFGGDPMEVAQANVLLAREIIPQHAWPAFWFTSGSAVKLAVMGLGCVAARRCLPRTVATAMAASLVLVVGGIVFVIGAQSAFAGLLFPWRASTYLYPLSLFVLVLASVDEGAGVIRAISPAPAAVATSVVAIGLGVLMSAESARELSIHRYDPAFELAAAVRRATTADDVIIIPQSDDDRWNRFRLATMRAVYVDRKSHPYLPSEVLEWKHRRDEVDRFYTLPDADRIAQCRAMGATAYVLDDGGQGHSAAVGPALVSCR